MNIRLFQKGDENAVSELICRTLKQCNSKDYPAEFIEENIRSHSPEIILLRAAESHFYVVFEGKSIIGCGGITGYWGSTAESYVFSVFVDATYQGRGIGRQIMETLEHDEYFLRAWRTELGASLTAVKFYNSLGYSFKNNSRTPDEFGVVRMEKITASKPEDVRISPCGDDCMKCPRFTAKSDDELKKLAELWHRIGWRDHIVSADEMRCDGCTAGKCCTYGILACQAKESVVQCRECSEYPCRKFSDVLAKSDFWQHRCQEVCSAEEYAMLKRAFFHKKENLELSCSEPEKRKLVSLKTTRLNISPMQDDELRKMISEQKIPELKQAFSEMLAGSLANPEYRIWYVPWKICQEDIVVGELGFKGTPKNGGVEIGYGMNPGYERRGLMTEAVEAAVEWALTQKGVDTVYAETTAENKASLRILEKLAFTFCGTGKEGPRFQKTHRKLI